MRSFPELMEILGNLTEIGVSIRFICDDFAHDRVPQHEVTFSLPSSVHSIS